MTDKTHVKHRATARIMLVDEQNRVFLLKTHFDPEVGLPPRWLTPGGGVDFGESTLQAAVRELYEETGMQVRPEVLGEPVLVASGRWDWADGKNYHTYTDTIYELKVKQFKPDTSGFTQDELRDILEYRWWNVAELITSDESLAPHELREWLRDRFTEPGSI
jgi:8-oxo-dGTP pyrophosphatase MutT (NUDIX family)